MCVFFSYLDFDRSAAECLASCSEDSDSPDFPPKETNIIPV